MGYRFAVDPYDFIWNGHWRVTWFAQSIPFKARGFRQEQEERGVRSRMRREYWLLGNVLHEAGNGLGLGHIIQVLGIARCGDSVLMVVPFCPVGLLVSTGFRFRAQLEHLEQLMTQDLGPLICCRRPSCSIHQRSHSLAGKE